MRKMKLFVNWTYRLLTLLIVGLATFSGELLITQANLLVSSVPKSCTLIDDNTKTTKLKLSASHLDGNTRQKLVAVFKADPRGQSSIGLDCSTPKPKAGAKSGPTPKFLSHLTPGDLDQYCKNKGFNNVTRSVDGTNPSRIFTCVGDAGGVVDFTHVQQIDTGGLTYVEACQLHVPATTQARYDDTQQEWDCYG